MNAHARGAVATVGLLLPLLGGGCAVGPNYQRPEVELPSAYRADTAAADPVDASGEVDTRSLADMPWWEVFGDPVLVGLIEGALANSYDLRIVASRVEQARYGVGVTRADLLPQLGYEAGAARGRTPDPFGGDGVTANQFLGAFQMAWEVDVWGRIRRATEASLANLLAAEDVRRGVVVSLVTDVAQAYFELRELDLELEIARRTRDSFQETLDLFTRQLVGGVGNKLATSRAEAALASTAAAIPELERQIVVKENQISILLGRVPGPVDRGTPLAEQPAAPAVPAGVPAALLQLRPDVLRAEQDIVAASALIGVSIADFLPRIGLTSMYGGQSSDLENILKGPASVWSVGGSLLGPVFQGGRLYYSYQGSVAAWEEAKLAWERTVLNALAEVSNALIAREKLAAANVELERQVAALRESVRLARVRFDGGFASYYEVIEAQQQLFPAENALAQNRRNQLLATVALYRALGGGWRAEEERHPERYPLRRERLDALVPVADPLAQR